MILGSAFPSSTYTLGHRTKRTLGLCLRVASSYTVVTYQFKTEPYIPAQSRSERIGQMKAIWQNVLISFLSSVYQKYPGVGDWA